MSVFRFADGVDVSDGEGITQCHHIDENSIIANISAENILPVLKEICPVLCEPLFFFIEIPCDEATEASLNKGGEGILHKEVYYLDGCTKDVILAVLKRYGELFVNDGLCEFGFASHESGDEVYVLKYKIVRIFSEHISDYSKLLSANGIPKLDKIKTAWDTFSESSPGTCVCVEYDGETIYDAVENLKEAGLYFSHYSED